MNYFNPAITAGLFLFGSPQIKLMYGLNLLAWLEKFSLTQKCFQ